MIVFKLDELLKQIYSTSGHDILIHTTAKVMIFLLAREVDIFCDFWCSEKHFIVKGWNDPKL